MNDLMASLEGFHDLLWSRVLAGVADRTAAARHPTLATVGPDGWPEARTVVLRHADRVEGVLEVHTDLQSAKVRALAGLPRAALHIWDPVAQVQIRIRAEATVHSGPEVAAIWAGVPDPSRKTYGVTPAPGTPIPGALDYDASPDPAAFAVLRCRALQIDALHLGARHRRAMFDRADDWAGTWLSP